MYCPKCKQTFEEGSRRFCPTDGARLITEGVPKTKSGVFANLISKMDPISDIDRAARPATAAHPAEDEIDLMDKAATTGQQDEMFFELDDEPGSTAMDETA